MSDTEDSHEAEASALVGLLEGISVASVALPRVLSPWSRAAQHLLKPLSMLSLRKISSAPPLPSTSHLQPILDYKCQDEPTFADIQTALAALLSLKNYEELALKYIGNGQGTQSGEMLVHAVLAKGYLWSFGSIFALLQRSPPGLIDDAVLADLLQIPERVLRGFFVHWQAALRVTADDGPEASQAKTALEVIRHNLTGLGAQLNHGVDDNEITETATAIIEACKINPLISTALAFTASQRHQVPRVIAPIPKMVQPTTTHSTTASHVTVSLGVFTSQDLYSLLHTLRNAIETVPYMHDARMSGEVDDPVAVVEDLALANERPLRLGLDLSLLKTDLALSVAVEQVRNAPHAPSKVPSAGGKRGRGSLSSSRSRSLSRKAEAIDNPEGNVDGSTPLDEIETPENTEARVKREEHQAIIAQWEARAEDSLLSTMAFLKETLLRARTSVIKRAGLLHHLAAEQPTEQSEAAIDDSTALEEGSSPPLSEVSSSISDESQTSSIEPASPYKPLEALIRLANRFFEWRIGRWESLALKEVVRRDTWTRGKHGHVGSTWDCLGLLMLSCFEQHELLRAGLEQDQLEVWLDLIAEQDGRPRTGKRRKSDQNKPRK